MRLARASSRRTSSSALGTVSSVKDGHSDYRLTSGHSRDRGFGYRHSGEKGCFRSRRKLAISDITPNCRYKFFDKDAPRGAVMMKIAIPVAALLMMLSKPADAGCRVAGFRFSWGSDTSA